MIIKEVTLKNFRNYQQLNLQFHEKVNLILGENAQGKTNILESIYLASFGRSFRTLKDSEMIRFSEETCKAEIIALDREKEEKHVEISIGKEGKSIKINDLKIKKISELMNQVFIVIFSPEDLKIVKDDPEKRRKFMDRELCQIKPSYFSHLTSYKHVLLQRNAYLKEKGVNEDVFIIWDDQLIDYGSKIIAKRKEFIDKINKISNEIHQKITDGKENLEIIYEASMPFYEDPEQQVKLFNRKLKESFRRDLSRGNTAFGPHKDDLKICINDIDIRSYGSQGQQRTAALSMKLAELALIEEETGEKPILLLDDVLSELDHQRQQFLIHSLQAVQLFITTTEVNEQVQKSLPEGYTFYVKEAAVEKK